MGNIFRVRSNIQELQSDIDFYLNITSTQGIKNQEDLRKYFFGLFMEDERDRKRILLENLNNSYNNTGYVEDSISCKKNEDNCYVEHGRFVEDYTNCSKEVVEEVDGNSFLSFVSVNSSDSSSDINTYVPHGRFVEDCSVEETSNESSEDSLNEYKTIMYSEHGRFVEKDKYNCSEHGRFVEDFEKPEEVEDEFELYSNENEEDVEEGESLKLDNNVDTSLEECVSNVEEFGLNDNSNLFSSDSNFILEDLEDNNESSIEDNERTSIDLEFIDTFDNKEVSKDEDSKNISSVESEHIEVPRDIRDFLRKYPNSPIEFVLKYYDKKDVEKQVKLGRIYKRKGKLMI
jgi:hypothetical protein